MDSKEAIKVLMDEEEHIQHHLTEEGKAPEFYEEMQNIADALNYAIASIDMTEHLNKLCKSYEEKLKSLMSKDAYERYVTSIARDMFLEDINNMSDSKFKDFCIDNFDLITGKEPGDEDITGIDPNSES